MPPALSTFEMLLDIIEETDGIEATISLANIKFCISMSTLEQFKRELGSIIEAHRI